MFVLQSGTCGGGWPTKGKCIFVISFCDFGLLPRFSFMEKIVNKDHNGKFRFWEKNAFLWSCNQSLNAWNSSFGPGTLISSLSTYRLFVGRQLLITQDEIKRTLRVIRRCSQWSFVYIVNVEVTVKQWKNKTEKKQKKSGERKKI